MKRILHILSGFLSLALLLPPVRAACVPDIYIRFVYLLALAFALSYFFTPFVIKIATHYGVVDRPSARKVHQTITPLWGGVAICLSFAIVTIYNFDFSLAQKGVAVGGTMLVLVGMLDDKFGVSAKLRLLAQIAAASIAIWCGARMSFLPAVWWGDTLEIVLSFIWIIGITNAMNFLDGMDGLCAGLTFINACFFAAVALKTNQHFFMFLSAALGGACLGFLPFNFIKGRPGRIFLGDAGSTFLGFMLAGIALMGDWAVDNYVSIIVPLIILAIPIFDMTLTTYTRVRNGLVGNISEWLHYTGRDHFHHRLSDMGFGKRRTVQLIHLFAICLGINGFILTGVSLLEAGLLLLETIVLFVFLGYTMVFVKNQYLHRESQTNR